MQQPERAEPPEQRPAPRTWSDEEDRALRLWVALARCYGTFSKAVAGRVQEYGLTVPQFGVLEALYHLGPLSLGDLADKLLVTGGNITYVMDRLELMGLVARDRSEQDRRVVMARLTPEGRALIAKVFPDHARFIAHLTRHLTPVQQEQLRGLLRQLGRGIQEADLATG